MNAKRTEERLPSPWVSAVPLAVLTVLLALLFHFVELPWFVQLVLWLVPFLLVHL